MVVILQKKENLIPEFITSKLWNNKVTFMEKSTRAEGVGIALHFFVLLVFRCLVPID